MVERDAVLQFDTLTFKFDATDKGGLAYRARGWYEESRSALYAAVEDLVSPKWSVDVGANYGLTALFASRSFPHANIIAVEPNPALTPYLLANFKKNFVSNAMIFQGILGDRVSEWEVFHVNPDGSQDSRVFAPSKAWKAIIVEQTTLDILGLKIGNTDGLYIKIDTQGSEERIFRGGENLLGRNERWVVKSEFAPHWLRSQGADPLSFLEYLARRYIVSESPSRSRFGFKNLAETMSGHLKGHSLVEFLHYVENLDRDGMGRTDLLIIPKALYAHIHRDTSAVCTRTSQKSSPQFLGPTLSEIAMMKSTLSKLESEIKSLRRRDLSLDIVSVMRGLREAFVKPQHRRKRASSASGSGLALENIAHGHDLLMRILVEDALADPARVLGKRMVEVGTTRERRADQGSTEKLALFSGLFDISFTTVDMDPINTARANKIIPLLNYKATAVTAKGEEFLAHLTEDIDFLYLDAFDFEHNKHSEARKSSYRENLGVEISNESCWNMHLACAIAIAPKIRPGGIVVIDDTWTDGDGVLLGKGKLAVPFLLQNGFEINAAARLTIALRKR